MLNCTESIGFRYEKKYILAQPSLVIPAVDPQMAEGSAIEIGDEEGSVFHVEAIFNPFNREGQKFSSIMSVKN